MLAWKIGVEIELLAPPGMTRADLAQAVARRVNGTVSRFFHRQLEPSAAPGHVVFESLMPGFAVADADGDPLARFVDDLTLQADFDPAAPPATDWVRLLSDDGRLLQLAARQCDPTAGLDCVLGPLADLFGTHVQSQQGVRRVGDRANKPVALAAPVAGGRERACEIITAPIRADHHGALALLLDEARALGFAAPHEGATHLHFDAAALCDARVIARLVDALTAQRDALRGRFGVNPHCRRLGPWPDELMALTQSAAFQALDWPAARAALGQVGLTKYCDFNLVNIAAADLAKHTLEVRILPVHLSPEPIIATALEMEAILRGCVAT